jgi:hypothetical protein
LLEVERWAEIRRMRFVERLSIARSPAAPAMAETAQRAICSDAPPRYARARAGSKLDPFKDEIERCCVRTRGCRACGCLSAVRGRFLGAPLVWADLLFFHSGGEGC